MLLLLLLLLPSLVISCGPGYQPWYDGHCFHIQPYKSKDGESHSTSVSACLEDDAALPTILSADENDLLYNLAHQNGGINNRVNFWIGLRCNGERFVWPSGEPADYTNFDQDYECNAFTVEYHFYIMGDLLWRRMSDFDTPNITNFRVCESIERTSTPCDNFEQLSTGKGSDICYKLQKNADNWNNANVKCELQSSTLAVIHEKSVNDFIRRTAISHRYLDGMHIGLSTTGNGNYTWADGTEVDYQNYASGYPDASKGNCMTMETGSVSGQWMNVDCKSKSLPYMCTRNAFVPTDIQPSGCPVDNQYAPGDNIYSPSYPLSTGQNQCNYTLFEADENKKVELDILFLEANTCCDSILVYDGLTGTNFITTVTGYHNGKLPMTIKGKSNAMRLVWAAGSGSNVRGFHAVMRSV